MKAGVYLLPLGPLDENLDDLYALVEIDAALLERIQTVRTLVKDHDLKLATFGHALEVHDDLPTKIFERHETELEDEACIRLAHRELKRIRKQQQSEVRICGDAIAVREHCWWVTAYEKHAGTIYEGPAVYFDQPAEEAEAVGETGAHSASSSSDTASTAS